MTQKELLYLEDAIGHEDSIICIIKESLNCIEDKDLITFFKNELKKHDSLRTKIINKLGDKANAW